jgi:hypothetical protein
MDSIRIMVANDSGKKRCGGKECPVGIAFIEADRAGPSPFSNRLNQNKKSE